MSITNENVLVAPCGLSCEHCPLYLAKDPAIKELYVSKGFSRDKLPCQGCRPAEGKRARVACAGETSNDLSTDGNTCATYACSVEHGVDFCYECSEFPCVKLQPCADMADVLPQNLKVFLLCCLKRQGCAEWLKNYYDIMGLHRFGKMVIGEGPQMTEDGKRAIQDLKNQLQQNAEPGRSHEYGESS
ncbi:MAG TPA: DUF3795 domain-containing protein [Ignavibacteria bacterium]